MFTHRTVGFLAAVMVFLNSMVALAAGNSDLNFEHEKLKIHFRLNPVELSAGGIGRELREIEVEIPDHGRIVSFELGNPRRLALDIDNFLTREDREFLTAEDLAIPFFQVLAQAGKTALLFSLSGETVPEYKISERKNAVFIIFPKGARGRAVAPVAPAPIALAPEAPAFLPEAPEVMPVAEQQQIAAEEPAPSLQSEPAVLPAETPAALAVQAAPQQIAHDSLRIAVRVPGKTAGALLEADIRALGINSFALQEVPAPNRIVIDLEGVTVNRNGRYPLEGNALVSAIRIGRQEGKTRVVFDVLSPVMPANDAQQEKGAVILRIREGVSAVQKEPVEIRMEATPAPAPEAPTAVPVPTPQEEEIQIPTLTPEPAEALEKEIEAPVPEIPQSVEARAHRPAVAEETPVAVAPGAKYTIDHVEVVFGASSRPVENISLKNIGEETLYFTAAVHALDNPGSEEEQTSPSSDVLISPKRFSIKPGEQRACRIFMARRPSDTEKVYLARFYSVVRSFDDQQAEDEEDSAEPAGPSVLVIAQPAASHPRLKWDRGDDVIKIQNIGNISAYLAHISLCASGSDSCTEIPARRLYPGNVWEIDAEAEDSLKFMKKSADGFEPVEIPALE